MRAAGPLGCVVIAFAIAGPGCRARFDQVPDAAPDAASLCRGEILTVCLDALPTEALTLERPTDVNTDTSPLCSMEHDRAADYCVIVATDITVKPAVYIRAHGAKPLVLLATGTISMQGSIDVHSSYLLPGVPGAGGNAAACPTGGVLPIGAGGGYGGSLSGRGGLGQPAKGSDLPASPPSPVLQLPPLHGGCRGANGATTGDPVQAGLGGAGGGAVALIASTIRIRAVHTTGSCRISGLADGCIDASGAGGRGGGKVGTGAGGGGGGTGGMIILDATAYDTDGARLFATGGGGGQGGGPSGSGLAGQDPSGPGTAAPGGIDKANTESGDGADGSTGVTLDGASATDVPNGGGGGGGGGAAGFIYAPIGPGNEVDPPSANLLLPD